MSTHEYKNTNWICAHDTRTHTHTHAHTHMHTCTHAHAHTHTHTHTHAHTHMHTRTCTHAHTHTHTPESYPCNYKMNTWRNSASCACHKHSSKHNRTTAVNVHMHLEWLNTLKLGLYTLNDVIIAELLQELIFCLIHQAQTTENTFYTHARTHAHAHAHTHVQCRSVKTPLTTTQSEPARKSTTTIPHAAAAHQEYKPPSHRWLEFNPLISSGHRKAHHRKNETYNCLDQTPLSLAVYALLGLRITTLKCLPLEETAKSSRNHSMTPVIVQLWTCSIENV